MIRHSRVSPTLTRALELLFMVLFLVCPLIISTRLKQVFNTPKYALVGLVAVCMFSLYAVDCLMERRLRAPRNPGWWCLAGFLGWAGLSLLWSSDVAVASRDLGYHSAMVMLFLGGFVYGREEDRVDNLLHFPIAAGVLAAGFGLLQYYGLDARILKDLQVAPVLALFAVVVGAGAVFERGAGLLSRPALYLALFAGLAASLGEGTVLVVGVAIVAVWFFLRWTDPSQSALSLITRVICGVMVLMLAGMIDGQLLLLLSLAILLDEESEWSEEGTGPVLLATGLLAAAITAWRGGWELTFLILPKKPEEVVKVYSFMGHRNYLAGFLIAVLPLAFVRMIAAWCVVNPADRVEVRWRRLWSASGLGDWVAVRARFVARVLGQVLPGLGNPAGYLFRAFVVVTLAAAWAEPAVGAAILALGVVAFVCVGPYAHLETSELWVLTGRVWKVGVYLAAITLMSWVLMLCHTRGAWIGAGVSLGAMAVFLLLKYWPLRPHGLLGLVGGVVLFVVAATGWKHLELPGLGKVGNPLNRHGQSAGRRLAETFNIHRGSAFQRALIYRTTWWIIFDHPINCLFGTGIGTYGLNYMPAQREVLKLPGNAKYLPETNKSIYAHNEYWHYWSEVGLVGLLLLFGAAYGVGRAAHLRLRQEPPGAPALMFLGMCASLVATMAHNYFTFDWHLAYTGATFYAVAGMVLAQCDGEWVVWHWGTSGRAARGEAEVVVRQMDGQVVAAAACGGASAGAALVLEGPDGKRERGEPDDLGEFEVALDEQLGPYRAWLEGEGVDRCEAALEVSDHANLALPSGLLGVALLQVVLVNSLANDLRRDMFWRDGFLKFRMRRFEEAFLDYERAVDADPTKGEVLFDFGRALMDSNRNDPAIEVFGQAKDTFVDPANDHNIALCYYKKKDIEAAKRHYRRAIKLNPIYEQSLANLGYLLLQQGEDEEAEELLLRGWRRYSRRNPSFDTSLGILYAKLKRFEEAWKHLERAVKKAPKKHALLINAGTVAYQLKKFEEAEEMFSRALALKPKDPLTIQKVTAMQLHKWSKEAQARPDDLVARRNYAAALLAAGHVGTAAGEARNLLKAVPDDWRTIYTYAKALARQGYNDDAARQFERFLAVSPASGDATAQRLRQDAEATLNRIRGGVEAPDRGAGG